MIGPHMLGRKVKYLCIQFENTAPTRISAITITHFIIAVFPYE
jgi:hypothetical protein